MHEGRGGVVAGGLAVGREDDDGEVGRPQPVEVHGQEPDIQHRVPEPQSVVELEAVDDPRPVLGQIDVSCQQVAVSVHDPAVSDPGLQKRRATPQVRGGERGDLVDDPGRILPHAQSTQVIQRLGPQSGDDPRVTGRVDLGRVRTSCVQSCDLPGYLAQPLDHAGPAPALLRRPHHLGETVPFRQPTHSHDVLDHLVVGPPDLQYAGVHVRGEPAVERDLPAALLPARFDRAVVEKAQIERFADFVSLVTTEKDERAVGLHHSRRPPRLGARPA